uniref:Transglycosylase SLT domain-containing protein n=1 Tax=Thermorudis peleae TaxID=1382356 RepID=A0A831X7P1_9BACT
MSIGKAVLRLVAGCALVASLAGHASTHAAELSVDPLSLATPVPDVWYRFDGQVLFESASRSWLLGPAVRAVALEPYRESPSGARTVYYFDKGRLELTHPERPPGDPSRVTSGLLVREMIAGQIQLGDATFIAVAPAQIPVAGDTVGNALAPTYAALQPLASVGENPQARRQPNRVGQPVTALVRADGQVVENAVADSTVAIGYYEERLGHNIPQVFWDWMNRQSISWQELAGLPLTEPFWIDTVVGGRQERVLIQAFERRVLTYTPANPEPWRVEANNAGQHYRAWRELSVPDDRSLLGLAGGVPLGEIIVSKAVAQGVDPYLFAALAAVASNFDPLAVKPGIGLGLFQVPIAVSQRSGVPFPLDPAVNAELAARELKRLASEQQDWHAALALYLQAAQIASGADQVLQKAQEYRAAFQSPPTLSERKTYRLIARGQAAYYDPGYTVAWWEGALRRHAGWGGAVPGWQLDPNGYYCVHPDFRPGQRLFLTANGVGLWCTIGDTVATHHVAQWRSRWAVELSWSAFEALRLDQRNSVSVWTP